MNKDLNVKPAKQTFTFKAPAALSVLLVGDFTKWQSQPIPLNKEAGGVWKVTTQLAPGSYHYRFIVDGEWREDPECTVRVDNPFGGKDDVVTVAAAHSAKPQTAAAHAKL